MTSKSVRSSKMSAGSSRAIHTVLLNQA
jgi:DNA-binding HxlR family transcriptional regulator